VFRERAFTIVQSSRVSLSTTTLQPRRAQVVKNRRIHHSETAKGSRRNVPGVAEAVEDRIEVRLEVRPGDVLHRRDTPPTIFLGRRSRACPFSWSNLSPGPPGRKPARIEVNAKKHRSNLKQRTPRTARKTKKERNNAAEQGEKHVPGTEKIAVLFCCSRYHRGTNRTADSRRTRRLPWIREEGAEAG
jgi:hypothetical protein